MMIIALATRRPFLALFLFASTSFLFLLLFCPARYLNFEYLSCLFVLLDHVFGRFLCVMSSSSVFAICGTKIKVCIFC